MSPLVYKRPLYQALLKRLREPRRFIQVLAGPRQVGKTVLARQVMDSLAIPSLYASADEPTLRDRTWLEQQWELARLKIDPRNGARAALLVLDEVQKVAGWSEVVKRLWDEDSNARRQLKVILLGSAPLLVQRGLTESLAGRFEILPASTGTMPRCGMPSNGIWIAIFSTAVTRAQPSLLRMRTAGDVISSTLS
jgi:uncharacterized protein